MALNTRFFDQFLNFFILQNNALKVITPATLEVLLKMLSSDDNKGPTNELRQELFCVKDLVLKCIICMVHIINSASADKVREITQVLYSTVEIVFIVNKKTKKTTSIKY